MNLNNKSILITGGTGSLGKALTNHIFKNFPKISRLVIFLEMNKSNLKWHKTIPLINILRLDFL